MNNVVKNNKTKNIVIIIGIIFFIILLWFTLFVVLNEVPSRIYYKNRSSFWGSSMEGLLVCFPIMALLLYFLCEKKVLKKIEITSIKGNLFLLVSWIISVIVIYLFFVFIIGEFIPGGLGYCNTDLEDNNVFWFGPCFLSGIEYLSLLIDIFIPVIIIFIWKIIKGLVLFLKKIIR